MRSAYRNKDGYFLRAESFYNVSSELDRISGRAFQMINYGGMLHEYSHGESFLALVQNRLSGNGLFIFDEPESALYYLQPVPTADSDERTGGQQVSVYHRYSFPYIVVLSRS